MALSNLEYHVLLALASGPLYGYAITEAVAIESEGTLTPRAGSLYRVIARLMSEGLIKEASPPRSERAPHPGLARKYYALTAAARGVLLEETQRLKAATRMAEDRLGAAPGGGRS
jgi:PadR family transcriptional regulator, regulatory protein PadR